MSGKSKTKVNFLLNNQWADSHIDLQNIRGFFVAHTYVFEFS